MTGFVDRDRAAALMARAGLDALVLSEPESFQYVTGASMGPAGLFRQAGAGFAVIPQQTDMPIGVVAPDFQAPQLRAAAPTAVVRTHPVWIETAAIASAHSHLALAERIEAGMASLGRSAGFSRPATFDLTQSVRELRTLLAGFGLEHRAVGIDLDFISVANFSIIQALLPKHILSNGSPVFERLRAAKAQGEIDLLQQGIVLSESGLLHMQHNAVVGMSQADLVGLYRTGVADAARGSSRRIVTAEYVGLGAIVKAADAPSTAGDPVKADMVCTVEGYASDMSRNFVFEAATQEQLQLHAIAERAFEDGLAALVPGRPLAGVHRAASDSLARQGLRSYRRGHFGHGVGQSVFSEQWPFIAADSDAEIEIGMVLAFEIPLYVEGLASFNLEDQFLITQGGPVSMNRMPREIGVIAPKSR